MVYVRAIYVRLKPSPIAEERSHLVSAGQTERKGPRALTPGCKNERRVHAHRSIQLGANWTAMSAPEMEAVRRPI